LELLTVIRSLGLDSEYTPAVLLKSEDYESEDE